MNYMGEEAVDCLQSDRSSCRKDNALARHAVENDDVIDRLE